MDRHGVRPLRGIVASSRRCVQKCLRTASPALGARFRLRKTALTLLIQLIVTALLSVLMTLVHGAGVVAIARVLRLDRDQPGRRGFHLGTIPVLSGVALLLFALHSLEIALFAGFYLAVGAFAGLEEALFYSTTAYATLSQPAETFPVEWRLVGALEGLIGFLLIGWSTAFLVTDMNRLLRD